MPRFPIGKLCNITMTADGDEQDVYIGQLRELFKSCDISGRGLLGIAELRNLCAKLQLGSQSQSLIHQLLRNNETGKVISQCSKSALLYIYYISV